MPAPPQLQACTPLKGLIEMVLANPAGVFAEQARFSFDGLIGLVRKIQETFGRLRIPASKNRIANSK
jgi:hypothetical protein